MVSVENMDESHFLTHKIQPLGNKVGGFWIGLYQNVEGMSYFQFLMEKCFANMRKLRITVLFQKKWVPAEKWLTIDF